MHYEECGNAALGDDEDLVQVKNDLVRDIGRANEVLANENMTKLSTQDRMSYILKSFSRFSDSYECPKHTNKMQKIESANWFNYMRTAPTVEHLLRRLGEFAQDSSDPEQYVEKRLKYAVYLWRTRERWAFCSMRLAPEFGIGTNNHSESYISKMRRFIPNNSLDLRPFAVEIGKMVKPGELFHGINASLLNEDGENPEKVKSIEKRLRNNLNVLITHMQQTNVSDFAKRSILQNADEARGLKVIQRNLHDQSLKETELKSIIQHSALGMRFIKLLDIFQMSSQMLKVLQVTRTRPSSRGKGNDRVTNFYAFVTENGSYCCSCGYPTYFGGVLCPHLIACFEQGYISFHAVFNLHPFLILPPSGTTVDFAQRSLFPLVSRHPAAKHITARADIIIVNEHAQWNIVAGLLADDEPSTLRYLVNR